MINDCAVLAGGLILSKKRQNIFFEIFEILAISNYSFENPVKMFLILEEKKSNCITYIVNLNT